MTIRQRFLILATLFCAFLIIAPTIIFLALGYRLNFSNWSVIHTGIFMARSTPKDAEIFLNGEKQNKKTPATIRYLTPGEYDITINKEGYLPWKKQIFVYPDGVATALPDNEPITLFFSRPEVETVDRFAIGVGVAGGRRFFWSGPDRLRIGDLDSGTIYETEISLTEAPISKLIFSKDGSWALAKTNREYVVGIDTRQTFDLTVAGVDAELIEASIGDKVILLNRDGVLWSLNTRTGISTEIKNNVRAMAIGNDSLITAAGSEMSSTNLASTTFETLNRQLPVGGQLKITSGPSGQIFGISDGALYRLWPDLAQLERGPTDIAYLHESNTLIAWNDYTIWLLRPKNDFRPELFIRAESGLSFGQINPSSGHLFYLQGGKLKATELSGETGRHTTNLLESEKPIKSFLIDKEGKTIYFIIAGEGLYKTKIR